jgi:hypothetical protein
MLLSGASARSVISPGCARTAALMKSTAPGAGAIGSARRPSSLGERGGVRGRFALGHHHLGSPEGRQETAHQEHAGSRVAPRGGHADHLQPRIAERQGQGEGVIDVVADVGVDDHQLPGRRGGDRRKGRDEPCQA